MRFHELKNGFHYGMHGCGFYKGVYHVNAYEPFKYWQQKGVQVMEIDIAKTNDGLFVALAHLMNNHYLNLVEIAPPPRTDLSSENIFTEEWFMNQRLCTKTTKGLSPMNLPMIVNEMVSDSGLFIMFDLWKLWKKDDTRSFAQQLRTLFEKTDIIDMQDRCVIEVYNMDQLNEIRDVSKQLNIMYCVHGPQDVNFDENVNPTLLKGLGVYTISFPWMCTKDFPGELEKYHQEGFTIFSLFKDNRYRSQMRKCGVNVNLVDTLYTPSNFIYMALQKLQFRCQYYIKRIKSKR